MANSKISGLTSASTPLAGIEVLPIVQSGVTVKVSVADLTAGRSVSAGALSNLGDVSLGNKSGTNDLTISGAATASVVTVGRLSSTSGDSTTFNVQNRLGVNVLNVSGAGNGSAAVTGTFSVTRGVTLCSATGDTNTGVGNVVQGTAAKGVDFSANTPAAGKTSTLLNWYEEGTWTPVVTDGTNNVSMASNSGWYIRVGNLVTVGWSAYYLDITSITATAQLRIKTLPFTSGSKDTWTSATFPYDASGKNYAARVPASGTQIYFSTTQASPGDYADLTRNVMGGNTSITFFGSLTYLCA